MPEASILRRKVTRARPARNGKFVEIRSANAGTGIGGCLNGLCERRDFRSNIALLNGAAIMSISDELLRVAKEIALNAQLRLAALDKEEAEIDAQRAEITARGKR